MHEREGRMVRKRYRLLACSKTHTFIVSLSQGYADVHTLEVPGTYTSTGNYCSLASPSTRVGTHEIFSSEVLAMSVPAFVA